MDKKRKSKQRPSRIPWEEVRLRYISASERPNVKALAEEYKAAPETFYRYITEAADRGDDWEAERQAKVRQASAKEAERRQREEARATADVIADHRRLLAVQRGLLLRKMLNMELQSRPYKETAKDGTVVTVTPELSELELDRVSKVAGRTVHDERLVHGLTTEHQARVGALPNIDDMTLEELEAEEARLKKERDPLAE